MRYVSFKFLNLKTTQSLVLSMVASLALWGCESPIALNSPSSGTSKATSGNPTSISVSFSTSGQTLPEDVGTPVTVNVVMSAPAPENFTIPYTVSGTASNPEDHDLSAGTLSFLQGDVSKTITLNLVNDVFLESTETIILSLGSPSVSSVVLGSILSHTISITDSDTTPLNPNVSFSTSAQTSPEAIGTVTVTAVLSNLQGALVTVPFTVTGTASGGGVDHDLANGNILIASGQLTGNATITIASDALDEVDETIIVTMGVPTVVIQGSVTVETITITDDDSAPTVQFTTATQSGGEGAGAMTITAQLSAASGKTVSVPFTVSGTAADPADYGLSTAGPLSFAPGATTATVTLTPVNDVVDENDETVILTLGAPTNATLGATTGHTATITDDDAAPTVDFSAAAQAVAESVGTATITVQLSAASEKIVSVPFTLGGTATGGGTDYSITASPVTIAAGSTSTTITVTVVDDALDENAETVIVTEGVPTNATAGATTVHTVTINDNDAAPTVNFSAAAQTVAESVGLVTVTASLSTASGLDVTVPFTVSGTSANPADHDFADGSITILAGATSGTATFTVVDDAIQEATETAIATMGVPTNATAGATNVHTVNITDNEPAPTVQWTVASQSGAENVGTMTVTAQLSAVSGLAVTVPYTITGTATGGGTDYSITASPITIAAGSTTADVTITVNDDALDEADETVILTIGVPTNATAGATSVHTATITDDDATPTVQWTAASQSGAESVGTMTVTAQLSAASGLAVTVPYTLTGTATGGGTDYSITASPITIAAGSTTADVTITVIDDTLDETNETAILTIGVPTNATAGATNVHTATITDNDAPPVVDFSAASQTVAENVGLVTVTASLSTASGLDVTVPFTVSGTSANPADHDFANASITILAGATSGTATFTVVDDALDEATETAIATMGVPTNATAGTTTVHTVSITDNDATPTVQWTAASQSGAESVGTMTFTAQLSAASGLDVTVPFTITGTATGGGTDYSITASPLTILAGATTADVTITVNDDLLDEANETVIGTIGVPTNATVGATNVHTATITDDDAAPVVVWTAASQSGAENVGTMTITAQIDAVSGQDVTVPFTLTGTATGGGTDYTITASPLTIAAGDTTAAVTITVVDDALDENNETVIATIGAPTNATKGATDVHTATITDNDATPTVEWTVASQSGAESAGTMTVTAQLSAASGLAVTVPFTLTGTATGGGTDYSVTASPLTIAAGSTTADATITVTDDTLDEANETAILTIGAPTNATKGATDVHTATITDNDATPTVVFSSATQTVAESVGTVTVTVNVSAVSGYDITVPYTISGTSANPADHDLGDNSLVILAGNASGSFTFDVVDDLIDENNETAIITMGVPTNATAGATNVQTVTINDNDNPPTVTFTAASQSGAENVGTMTITAQLSAASGLAVDVPFTLGGTATGGGTDYSITASPVTIAAGSTSTTITITVNDDALDEVDETVAVTMGSPTNASQGATTLHTATITDNDAAPTIAFTAASDSAAEGAGTYNAQVSLSAASGKDITVEFSATGGTATGTGTDYSISTSSPLTITAGSTTANIAIPIVDDALDEADETVEITLANPTNSTLGVNTIHTLTITDNDATPTVTLSSASQAVLENVGTTTVNVTLSAASGQSVTVPFTMTGTATNTTDYTVTASPLTFTAGQTSKTVTFTVTDDATPELSETAILTLDAPTNATLGATTVHTLTINDNEAPANLSYTTPNVYTVGTVITDLTPTVQGTVTSYSVNPALPGGLSIDGVTGIISGTPTTETALAVYTVTATNAYGDTTFDITITVNLPAPTNLTYSADPVTYPLGIAITNNTPSVTGTVASYSVSPALPTGLSLNTTTGVISGTPTVLTAQADYTVTATNSGGNTTQAVTITIDHSFTVNSTGDGADVNAGDGICETGAGNGICTLRAAVEEANAYTGKQTISVPASTITLGGTEIPVTTQIEIYGAAMATTIVTAASTSRVFNVSAGTGFKLDKITLTAGTAAINTHGGVLYVSGVPLTISEVTLSSGSVTGTGTGGCLYVTGAGATLAINKLTINNCTSAAYGGGGVFSSDGGGTLDNLVITNNTGVNAGGLYVTGGTASTLMTNALFTGNNSGTGLGGGIYSTRPMTLTNVTFTANTGLSAPAMYHNSTTGNVIFKNNAVVANTSTHASGYGIGQNGTGTIRPANSVFEDNTNGSAATDNCSGTFSSLNYNISDTASTDCNTVGANDVNSTEANFGALADNGGYFLTILPPVGSSARDTAGNANCTSRDARNLNRPYNVTCDKGPVEAQSGE